MENKKTPKIGIIGFFGYQNAGDEAMKDILLNEFPNSVANNQGEMPKCDAYIYAGGDLVQKKSGFHMSEIINRVKDEPLYALSLGTGDDWQVQKEKVKNILSKFRLIYTRDQKSMDELSTIVKISGVMPDLVLLTDAPFDTKNYPILFNYTDRPELNPDGQFQDILQQKEMLPVALSSRDYDTKYADINVDYKKFISMAKTSQGVIGTRLHAIVMGVIAGVPVAGIAYNDKVRRFCQRYNIPCFNYEELNGKEIVQSMKKADINLQDERAKIKKVISDVKKDLYGEK